MAQPHAYVLSLTLFLCFLALGEAQDQSTCYSGGSIAASVIITILVILILVGAGYYACRRYGKYKKGQHLILETDPEKGSEYVFDNPGFKDASLTTPAAKELDKSKVDTSSSNKAKWTNWSTLTSKNERRKTQDDSVLNDQGTKVVTLRSHDFTGLGFNICGNMRDGIYIKDILHHGPAFESGKLSPGDRITGITINFENMVFDDALTILSYASPYEVTIEAKNGKLTSSYVSTAGQPNHPIYKSSSSTDLLQIGKSAKKRLFQAEDHPEPHPAQKIDNSPKKPITSKKPPHLKLAMNADQLKNQLEQKILEDHNENLKQKQNYEKIKVESAEVQRSGDAVSKYQKFGIKVLPMEQKEQKSPKSAELSQNDNNINIERNEIGNRPEQEQSGTDEVDKKNAAPPVKKRDKKIMDEVAVEEENFVRENSLNSSGIRRDVNGIPQEIPNHMMNAAVAARRNRKTVEEKIESSTPKRQKGKAPAPPEGLKCDDADQIESPPTPEVKTELKDYNTDSEEETDNQSSVNTIELNSSDITIHQTEENADEKQNRKTASTGDLTKIHKNRKTSTGTLERAQSLDITDTGMPVMSKKRKVGKSDEKFDSGDSLYNDALINKEPRLSLILDGLNTFQRSRLKKSTEWGNLEDAILNLSSPGSDSYETSSREELDNSSGEFGSRKEFDALVNKINEIKQEISLPNDGVDGVKIANKPDEEDIVGDSSFVSDVLNAVSSLQNSPVLADGAAKRVEDPISASTSMLSSEREFCKGDYYPRKTEEDTNVSDDMKVSRHSLGSLERVKLMNTDKNELNVSNVSVSDSFVDRKPRDGDNSDLHDAALKPREGDTGDLNKTQLKLRDGDTSDLNKTQLKLRDGDTSDSYKTQLKSRDVDTSELYKTPLKPRDGDTSDLYKTQLKPKDGDTNNDLYKMQLKSRDGDTSELYKAPLKSRDGDTSDLYKTQLKAKDGDTNNDLYKMQLKSRDGDTNELYKTQLKPKDGDTSDLHMAALKSRDGDTGELYKTPLKPRDGDTGDLNKTQLKLRDGDTSDLYKMQLKSRDGDTSELYKTPLKSRDGDTSELYKTALDETLKHDEEKMHSPYGKVLISTPDLIKNVTIAEAIHDLNNEVTIEGPTSLTFEIPAKTDTIDSQAIEKLSNGNLRNKPTPSENKSSLTYITEIQVITPNSNKNVSEIEIIPTANKNLDSEFENFVKNFEIKSESIPPLPTIPTTITAEKELKLHRQKSVPELKMDAEKELSKIQEIAEEQLKKLPEMRFTTSSYEPAKIPEKRQSQIEILRSNFEKSPPKSKQETPQIKSRIPIATSKTPPTSPERRDSKNLDFEVDKDIIAIMTSGIHSTPKTQQPANKNAASRNVTVTSIRNSKIPSGLPTYSSRPPVPPRKSEPSSPEGGANVVHVSANGGSESNSSSFKQWVFNPSEGSVTNITVVTDNNKLEK